MYNVKIYDNTLSFRNVRKEEKYSILIHAHLCLDFSSKRKAFDFLSKVSHLLEEQLAFCEMVVTAINTYSFHIKPYSPSIRDIYYIYTDNHCQILKIIGGLKDKQHCPHQLYQIIMKFNTLFELITENIKIINKRNKNCVAIYQKLFQNSKKSFWKILEDCKNNTDIKELTIFAK